MQKFRHRLVILVILTGVIFTAQVFAQLAGNPENLCRNGFFPRESKTYRLARITGKKGEKIYFHGDEREDCPGGKDCRLKSYLIPGDEIIVSRVFGGYACGWFQPARGSETVGWIKIDNFEWSEEKLNISIGDWLGNWKYYDNDINIIISKNRGLLGITGNAIWKGLGDNVHVGELDDHAKPSGNRLDVGADETDESACKVSMQLVGKYLIVSDNLNCGGANVTFSGVYQRKSK
jgi:hypothetical protein